MKLAASNIAWKHEDNEVVAGLLRRYGFTGVEVTPYTAFTAPWWRKQGFEVVAMQGLLHGVEGASLWGKGLAVAVEGLARAIRLAETHSIPNLVFGCPSARNCADYPPRLARRQAKQLFKLLGSMCDKTRILIEPLGTEHGCWFLNSTREVAEFVKSLDVPSVRVHLDYASLKSTGEDIESTLSGVYGRYHFHASTPGLRPLGEWEDSYVGEMFREIKHQVFCYVSLEQRDHGLEALEESLSLMQEMA